MSNSNKQPVPSTTRSIIAISGKSGCGNSTVSRLVAEKLGRKLVNYTFHTMADELGIPFESLLDLAKTDDSYDKKLDAKQVAMAHESDCVIGSRLAVWLIKDAALSVYLYADSDVRAKRIHKREGGDLKSIKAFTQNRDIVDNERYKSLYNIDTNNYSFVDLIINTNRMPPNQIASIIIAAINNAENKKE